MNIEIRKGLGGETEMETVKESTTGSGSKSWKYIVKKSTVPQGWWGKPFDWSMNDSKIARLLGVSRQMVWKTRRDAGAPLSVEKGKREGTVKDQILSIPVEELSKMTVLEVAQKVVCSPGCASHVLKHAGSSVRKAVREPRLKFPGREDKAFWGRSNEDIAVQMGTTKGYVAIYRWRKGIPSHKAAMK